MDRRKELKLEYKETFEPQAGVYQIKNTQNNKIFIGSTPNLKTLTGQRMQLMAGVYRNKGLQDDWNQFGEPAFTFEVLEVLRKKEDEIMDTKAALKKLEKKWLENLQPFGERGYNKAAPASVTPLTNV
ncbi:GIY-YIG nuclease family protein [Sporomusa aerivorans]|uniref:GIY-YIG nuclease family protein n=1 Tax=Sporomusa aerivorans TaxID=204936 RepID=UPI003529FC60